jgi:hypothetical protein
MSTSDGFEATFHVRIDRDTAWARLTERDAGDGRLWLPGFDSRVTVRDAQPPERLEAVKADEPCAGTDIVVTLESSDTGTRIRVVQSRFGDWLTDLRDTMAIGWRHIVADLQTYLATGVHARRHLRPWGDLGARPHAVDGGVRVDHVVAGGYADRLGLADGDLLVTLAGAPVSSLDDLVTILRVLDAGAPNDAEWVRRGALVSAGAAGATPA